MASDVRCSVDNCVYWKSMKCMADNIQINMQGSGEACSSDNTCCETFETRETSEC